VRPENLIVGTEGLPVTIADATFLGDRLRRTLRLPDGTLLRSSGRPDDAGDPIGKETRACFASADAVILPA
jgi:putrescine transport system ATP-binding protein